MGSMSMHSLLSSCADEKRNNADGVDAECRSRGPPLVDAPFRRRSSSGCSQQVKVNYFERIREKNNNFNPDSSQHLGGDSHQNVVTANSVYSSSMTPLWL